MLSMWASSLTSLLVKPPNKLRENLRLSDSSFLNGLKAEDSEYGLNKLRDSRLGLAIVKSIAFFWMEVCGAKEKLKVLLRSLLQSFVR